MGGEADWGGGEDRGIGGWCWRLALAGSLLAGSLLAGVSAGGVSLLASWRSRRHSPSRRRGSAGRPHGAAHRLQARNVEPLQHIGSTGGQAGIAVGAQWGGVELTTGGSKLTTSDEEVTMGGGDVATSSGEVATSGEELTTGNGEVTNGATHRRAEERRASAA
ncbi:unnamed protein product [Closterium sp. NIES-64]|nr:unnamed protein product [Closterium sp. NIES-64]